MVTGCEVLSVKTKETYKSKLYESHLTKHVVAFVKDSILLVSLPDIKELEDEVKEKYSKKKDTSQNDLCALVQPPRITKRLSALAHVAAEETKRTGARGQLNDQDSEGFMARCFRFVGTRCSKL